MTDLEKLKKTFDEMGLAYDIFLAKDLSPCNRDNIKDNWDTLLTIQEGIGYMGFNCDFYFLNGKFVEHGCWE